MATQDLSVLIAVLEGLTKTCADLVVEVRELRQTIKDGGLVPAAPAEAPKVEDKPREQAAEKPATKDKPKRKEVSARELTAVSTDSPAAAWLAARGFRLVRHSDGNGQDRPLLPLAVELGDYFEELRPLHDAIRNAHADGAEFTVSLKTRAGTAITRCVQWAQKLERQGLLADVQYAKKEQTLSARAQAGGVAQSFFSGRWFELYVKTKVEDLLKAHNRPYDVLMNASVRLPDGQNRELDILFLVGDEPVWIECKSGAVRGHLKRLAKLRLRLQIPADHSILAVLDMPPSVAAKNGRIWGLSITEMGAVAEAVLRAVSVPIADETPAADEASGAKVSAGDRAPAGDKAPAGDEASAGDKMPARGRASNGDKAPAGDDTPAADRASAANGKPAGGRGPAGNGKPAGGRAPGNGKPAGDKTPGGDKKAPPGGGTPAEAEADLTHGELAAIAGFRPTPGATVPSGGLAKLLAKKQLPPQPDQRAAVLAALPEALRDGDQPITGNELVARLEARFPRVSQANLRGIVQAVMRGGGLPGPDGVPVKSLKSVLGQTLADPEQLDVSCRRAYAAAVVNTDLDWLQSAGNQEEFVRVAGGPLPPANQMAQIREQVAKRLGKGQPALFGGG